MAYNELEALLCQFDERDLLRLVPGDVERALRRLVPPDASSDPAWLPKLVLASHGTALFRRQDARKGLFRTLPAEELRLLAEEMCARSYEQAEDNALALSGLRWFPGSPVATLIARRFPVPYAFLPHASTPTPDVESLTVRRELPPLHDYQSELCEQLVRLFEQPGARALLQMPTGAGKTRTIVEALVRVFSGSLGSRSIVWLAHAEELCDQAADTIQHVWSEKGQDAARLVRFYGTHEPASYAVQGSVVVASLQKAYARLRAKSPFVRDLRSTAAAVVLDEAHRALAPSFQEVTEALVGPLGVLVGLSATPGRGIGRDMENKQLARMFDDRLVSPRGEDALVARLQKEGVLARLRRRLIETGTEVVPDENELESVRLGFDYGPGVLRILGNDQQRNGILVEIVEGEVRQGRPTLLFACTVAHARILSAALNLRGIPAAHIDGEMDRTDRYHAIEGFRDGRIDVLTNFGVLTTGFDAPRTRTVVVARPTTSAVLYGQMIGRALRGPRMGGGEEAWVVDVQDNLARFGRLAEVYDAFERFWGVDDS